VEQRRQLDELLDGRAVPVAILSRSARVRATLLVLSWFNDGGLGAFPPTASGLHEALSYLEIPTSRTALIEGELEKLRSEVEGKPRAGGEER
jgi:hypothetical protein